MDRPLLVVRSEINGRDGPASFFFSAIEDREGRRWWYSGSSSAARPDDSIRSAPVKTERGGEEESRGGVGFDRRAREVAGDQVQRRGSLELREKRGLQWLNSTGLWPEGNRGTR